MEGIASTLPALLEQAVTDTVGRTDHQALEDQLQLLTKGGQRQGVSDELLWALAALALTPLAQRPWPAHSSHCLRWSRTLYALLPQSCTSEDATGRICVFLKVRRSPGSAATSMQTALCGIDQGHLHCFFCCRLPSKPWQQDHTRTVY
jgi:hypothetical protein